MRTFLLAIIIFLIGSLYLNHLPLSRLGQLKNLVPNLPQQNLEDFKPDPEIASLADQATMTDKAKLIFYSTHPIIDTDRTTFEIHCQAPVTPNSVELGCYTSDNRIYILNISDPKLKIQMVVTASHEMLHAAYTQLSLTEENKVDQELEAELPKVENQKLAQELKGYRITEPGQRDNELHSIIGTEYPNIGTDLESYYSQYFNNRGIVVADAQAFNNSFTSLESKLNSLQSQIRQMRRQMNLDLRRGDISGYNNLVPQINSLISQYNQTVKLYNNLSRSLIGEESPTTNQ